MAGHEKTAALAIRRVALVVDSHLGDVRTALKRFRIFMDAGPQR
jgi:hypothetical protein